MTEPDVLDRARTAFGVQDWGTAFATFSEADGALGLAADDLERYARTAYLIGKDEFCVAVLERAFRQWRDAGRPAAAAECAFWLGFNLLQRGEMARAGGWLTRAEELGGAEPGSVVRGLLIIPAGLQALTPRSTSPRSTGSVRTRPEPMPGR
jgi:hypothetical protein